MFPFFLLLISVAASSCHKESELISIREEEVEFGVNGLRMVGTLFVPKKTGAMPAIAITHGSGKDTRSAGFRSLALKLANEGFVVLIFDKRGVGASEGTYQETPDMSIPAGDLNAAVGLLKQRKEVDPNRIGVYGHSQGGYVAPLAASRASVAFLVVACGGGVSLRETVLYSYSNDLRNQGYSTVHINEAIDFGRRLFTYLSTATNYAAADAEYNVAVTKPWFPFFRGMGFGDRLPPPSMLTQPVFDFFRHIAYDPMADLESLQIPTLVMLAGKDLSVPTESCREKWQEAFAHSGRIALLTIVVLPDEDHYDFVRSGSSVEYKSSFFNPLQKWLDDKVH